MGDDNWGKISHCVEVELETGEVSVVLTNLTNCALRAKPREDKIKTMKQKHRRPKNVENLQVLKVNKQLR